MTQVQITKPLSLTSGALDVELRSGAAVQDELDSTEQNDGHEHAQDVRNGYSEPCDAHLNAAEH